MKESTKEILDWMGELAIIHVTGKETDNRYSMVELYATKEGSPPWHVHHREDKGYYIIEGVVTIRVGQTVYKAKAGDYVHAPVGIPTTYTVDSKGYARIMLTFSPAGFENLMRAVGTPVSTIKPLKPEKEGVDYAQVKEIAREYGVEFVDEA
jgi:quercetin dioxygenase-like cupin family protein